MDDSNIVKDPKGLTKSADHEAQMERVALEVLHLRKVSAAVMRVTGRIAPQDLAPWLYPNLAVRLDVETLDADRVVNRIYTIAAFRPDSREVDIDFVLHEDDSPAMRWLKGAGAGTVVMMKGPRAHQLPNYAAGRAVAIFADDTALPAVRAMLAQWPENGPKGDVWIDSRDDAAFASLTAPQGVALHQLRAAPEAAPGTSMLLLQAAKEHLPAPAAWTVWAAGERKEMQDLRAYLRQGGLQREDMRLLGYWRLGQSSSDLDRERLAVYEKVRAAGLGIEEMRDLEAQP